MTRGRLGLARRKAIRLRRMSLDVAPGERAAVVATRRATSIPMQVATARPGTTTVKATPSAAARRRGPDRVSGVDAATALALKLRKHVGAHSDAADFIAFPVVPHLVDLHESPPFALIRLANQIVDPSPTLELDHRRLDEAWDDLLANAITAQVELDDASQAELDTAVRLLYEASDSTAPSEAYQRYFELLDGWLHAATVASEKRAANAIIEDVAVAEDHVVAAKRRLATEGRQDEIEQAIDLVTRVGRRGPEHAFVEARRTRRDSPGLLAADGKDTVPETSFIPPLDRVPWRSLQLDAGQMRGLLAEDGGEAPLDSVEAESLLFNSRSDDAVSAVDAEFAVITLVRPWLDESIFVSRAWRLEDGDGAISDGGDRAAGSIPAYITDLILLRNVSVTRQTEVKTTKMVRRRRDRPRTRPVSRSRPKGAANRPRVRDHRQSRSGSPAAVVSHGRPRRVAVRGSKVTTPSRSTRISWTQRVESAHPEPAVVAVAAVMLPRCPDPDPAFF